MSVFETIIYETDGQIATLTLNRPQALNVHNVRMRDEMHEVLSAVKDDADIAVVILRGAGDKAFCAGADLKEFLSAPPPTAARHTRLYRDLWGLFLHMPQPVIAALHGYVFGSGIEMAMCCDIRIAAQDVVFGLPEVVLGIIPAAGATQTFPRAVGIGHALDPLLTGRRLNAEEALGMKLVNRVVARDELMPVVSALAHEIAGYHQPVVRAIKQTINRGLDLPLAEGLEMERRLAAATK